MAILKFDEPSLVERVVKLDVRNRVATANACASRLLAAFEQFAELHDQGNLTVPRRAVEFVWKSLITKKWAENDIDKHLKRVMDRMPEEGDGWTIMHSLAEDAVASTAYALRSLASGNPQETVWAARRAYEAVDQLAMDELDVDLGESDAESKILSHPLVQQELTQQNQDLDFLEASEPDVTGIQKLKLRALSQNLLAIRKRA